MRIGPIEIAFIMTAVVLLIGTRRLPQFGKKAGEVVRDFKENSKEITDAVTLVKNEIDEVKEVITTDLTKEVNHG